MAENEGLPIKGPERGGEKPVDLGVEQPEQGKEAESSVEQSQEAPERSVETPAQEVTTESLGPAQESEPTAIKDPEVMQVERVLEEDLWEAYLALPVDLRGAFKRAGEDAAIKIREMGAEVIKTPALAYQVIMKWLRMIPKASPYFLMQAAKIKTDHLLKLMREQQGKDSAEIL